MSKKDFNDVNVQIVQFPVVNGYIVDGPIGAALANQAAADQGFDTPTLGQ